MNEWIMLELDGFLQRQELENSFTFTTVLPPNTEKGIDALRVGLGWVLPSSGLTKASFNPYPESRDLMLLNILLSKIAEDYTQLTQSNSPNWRADILLRKGYVTTADDEYLDKAEMFRDVDIDTMNSLVRQYSFTEIAFLVAAGISEDAEIWLEVLEDLQARNPNFKYQDALKYIRLGVPVQDLSTTIQLPFHLVEDLYGMS